MISEHKLANQFTSAWRDIMPMGDRYWRNQNMYLETYESSYKGASVKATRGTVNELAFIVFCKLSEGKTAVSLENAKEIAALSADQAIRYTLRFSRGKAGATRSMKPEALAEAADLALRQLRFFQSRHLVGPTYETRPKFRGCGTLSDCEGDVLTANTLFEVKAGERTFRITDLRQLLIYSALAHAAGSMTFSKIGLLNPRTGTFWIRDLDVVCRATSGLRAVDVFSKLVETVTQGQTSR